MSNVVEAQNIEVNKSAVVKNGMKKYAMEPNNVKLREWCDTYLGRTTLMSQHIYGSCIGMYKSGRRRVTEEQMKNINEAIKSIEEDERSGLIARVPRGGNNFSNLADNGEDITPEEYAKIRDSEPFIMFKHFLTSNKKHTQVFIDHFGLTFLSTRPVPSPAQFTDNNIERYSQAKSWVDAGADVSKLSLFKPKTTNRGTRGVAKPHTTVSRRVVSASMADRDVNDLLKQLENPALSNLVPVIYMVNYEKDQSDTSCFDRFIKNSKSKVYLIVTLRNCIKHAWDVINEDKPLKMVVH